MRPAPMLALLLLAVLAAAPAQAVFIETPLRFSPSDADADVGDEVRFDVEPANESAAAPYAGRTLHVRYATDAETEDQSVRGDAGTVTLDGDARGAFTWTIPAEVDDKNVFLTIVDGDETLATAHVRVGDAEPIMFAQGGGGGAGPAVVDGGGAPRDDVGEAAPDATNEAPGFTALAIVGGASVAVLVLAGRRR